MSNSPSSAVAPDLAVSSAAKPVRMLDGFPWISAIVLYTLSWGWSLLRPNTLYWDDWAVNFNKPKFYMWHYVRSVGRPPWSDLIETFLLPYGAWTVRLLSFLMFFVVGLFLFEILKSVTFLTTANLRAISLLFVIIPVNHARISLVIFDYSSSYFLFFLGWFLLVRYRSKRCFILSWLVLFLSLKTHSLLFFMLLPFLHFIWLNKTEVLRLRKLNFLHVGALAIAFMPVLYLGLRQFFWHPISAWTGYQTFSILGARRGLVFFVPLVFGFIWLLICKQFNKKISHGLMLFCFGSGIMALALLPYFSGNFLREYISIIAYRTDWGNRHLMLMPLGLAISMVGLNELFNWKQTNIVLYSVVLISLVTNLAVSSGYYLDSLKKDEVIVLLQDLSELNSESEIVLIDETKIFNGRGATYRDYELSGLLSLSGHRAKDISGKRTCNTFPNGKQFTLKSDKSYLKALLSRDLGLYFDVTPCSEVLAKDS